MIKVILWDMDGTILDFKISQKVSLKATYKYYGLGECSDETVALYSDINQKYWEMLERGEIQKSQVFSLRFKEFLSLQGVDIPPDEFSLRYESGLADVIGYIDDSLQLVASLKNDYKQYIVTNGALRIQKKKLKNAGFEELFDGYFISDEIGYEKPSKEFFDYVKSHIPKVDLSEILIVGDSLTSDIKGGNNIGIKTCWYNPENKPCPDLYKVDYNISNLNEIKNILLHS